MFTKWIINIDSLKGYRISEDGKIYRLPKKIGKRYYYFREIKKQYSNRYRLNNEWWSEAQIRPHLKIDNNPIQIYKTKDLPF